MNGRRCFWFRPYAYPYFYPGFGNYGVGLSYSVFFVVVLFASTNPLQTK